jgi:hypothetical protein
MKNKIYTALIENGYSERSAKLILNDLLQLSAPLDAFLVEWIENGTCKDFITEGFSIKDFQDKRSMKYPAALLTMDWLLKEPQKAKESLRRGLR